MNELEKASEEMEEEFAKVRESLGDVHVAFDAVRTAGPENDLHELLLHLEKAAKEARDGGIIGSGANAHRRARKDYLEIKNRF